MSPVSSYDADFEYGLPTHIPWNSSDDDNDDNDHHDHDNYNDDTSGDEDADQNEALMEDHHHQHQYHNGPPWGHNPQTPDISPQSLQSPQTRGV